jgi:hypothetical protein
MIKKDKPDMLKSGVETIFIKKSRAYSSKSLLSISGKPVNTSFFSNPVTDFYMVAVI